MAEKIERKISLIMAKLVFLAGFFAVIALFFFLAKEFYKKRQIQSEINKLQEEAQRISKKSLEIQDKIAYFESKDYQEREAKDKLNLRSPDENVIVIKPGLAEEQFITNENIQSVPEPTDRISNQKKWWNYFFKY
jgi:cell division protein FtsB